MISKKSLLAVAAVLLVAAALVAGGSRLVGQQALADPGGTKGGPQGDGPGHTSFPVAPALPAATGSVTFSEDFSKPDRVLPAGWHYLANAPGDWVAYQG